MQKHFIKKNAYQKQELMELEKYLDETCFYDLLGKQKKWIPWLFTQYSVGEIQVVLL